MQLVGDLTGLSVLDLACGDGFYARRFARAGAARVVGVDSSAAMISLAKRAQDDGESDARIEYRVGDARALRLDERFDLVTAAYLLNYAADGVQLLEMCQAAVHHLRAGGRFVGINNNPELGLPDVDYRPYGFERIVPPALTNGSPVTFRNYQDDGHFDVTVYYLDPATHEVAFTNAGLSGPEWLSLAVTPAGVATHEPGYWSTFLRHPPVVLFESCRRESHPSSSG